MPFPKMTTLAVAGLLAVSAIGAIAQDSFTAPATPEEAVAARIAAMKENGGIVRTLGNLTGDEAVAALTKVRTNYSHFAVLFPEGSNVGESEALPAIWQNWEAFTAILDTGLKAADDGIAAAQAGDAAAYKTAVQGIMGTCGQCHQQFRS